MPRALICGISGQDGPYLAKLLLEKGYEVWGTARDTDMSSFRNLAALGILDQVNIRSMLLRDFRSVIQAVVESDPHEIYNLAGQSSVGRSFAQPVETLESVVVGTMNLLECIRILKKPIRFYNAGSSECFGDTGRVAADETTPFAPRSPYGVAKAAAFWETANYREAYDIYACTGMLFNHESPFRPRRFVTRKIVEGACHIAAGKADELRLGSLEISRDWGWAPEYVDAMWRILQADEPDDFVIATGESNTLQFFVESVFTEVGLNWADHVKTDESLLRPSDILFSQGCADKAKSILGWEAKTHMKGVISKLVAAERARPEYQ